jgi:hypothetical protein
MKSNWSGGTRKKKPALSFGRDEKPAPAYDDLLPIIQRAPGRTVVWESPALGRCHGVMVKDSTDHVLIERHSVTGLSAEIPIAWLIGILREAG